MAAVTIAMALPESARAYDAPAHKHVTRQADSLWTFPELHGHLPAVIEGSGCEDNIEHIYNGDGTCGITGFHFWNADQGDFETTLCWGYIYDNAWVKGRYLLAVAVQRYWNYINTGSTVDLDSAYHYLGHTVHLLTDMAAPCHIHTDFHPNGAFDDACYEDWMSRHDYDEGEYPCNSWTWHDAVNRWGYFYVDGPTATMAANYLGDGCWEPKSLHASYYYLMYTTNQVTDYFASDSYDGDTDVRPGWGVDYTGFPATPTISSELDDNDSDPDNDAHGNLSNIANFAYTKAMSSVAALYRAWRDYWDNVAPATAATIDGHPEVHGGWRAGNVMITLRADDNSRGMAVHDSGVEQLSWWKDDSDSDVFGADVYFLPVHEEGVTPVDYQAMDRFGNLEALKSQIIKIDKSYPVSSILSPAADGLYLSDGSLTIDYEASDVPSGIYRISADLDGQPVSDGQVIPDLSHMAGYHKVTVAVEDSAGNITTKSTAFSIKIHATIDINPEVLSTKSNGRTMTAHVEFPLEYDVRMIDPPTGTLTAAGTTVPAKPWPSPVGKRGPDGLPGRTLEFDRRPICAALTGVTDLVTMTCYGRLVDSTEFYGTDSVQVFSPPRTGGNAALSATAETVYDGGLAAAMARATPLCLVIEGASPNPFAQNTVISFGLPKEGPVELDLYDVSGHLVRNLVSGEYPAGYHTVGWRNDGTVEAGLYILRLRRGSDTATRKLVITR